MEPIHWIIIATLFAIAIVSYFKAAKTVSPKQPEGILYAAVLLSITLISLFIVIITVDSNAVLAKQSKQKPPVYEKIVNVYILKK